MSATAQRVLLALVALAMALATASPVAAGAGMASPANATGTGVVAVVAPANSSGTEVASGFQVVTEMTTVLAEANATASVRGQLAPVKAPVVAPSLRGAMRSAGSTMVMAASASSALDRHNLYRAWHGAGALSWDSGLAAWATSYAQQCVWAHSGRAGVGENLYMISGADLDEAAAVDSWYNEVSLYDFNNPGFSGQTGHFTQVVWVSTTTVGCGSASCRWGNFFVCQYSPPGNVLGQFQSNVLPASGSPASPVSPGAQCSVTLYTDCNFQGAALTLTCTGSCQADYTWLSQNTAFQNGAVSSVQVGAGCKATLWQDGDYTGSGLVIPAGSQVSCLVDYNFNDMMSSLVLESA